MPQPRIKAAFLALDLGRWDMAQTLAEPLVHSADLSAAQLGLVALMRSYRLTNRARDAWSAFETWRQQHPQCPLTWNLAWEAFHCAEHIPSVSLAEMNRFQAILNTRPEGVAVYLQRGQAERLPVPPALAGTSPVRRTLAVLQLGVFRDQENAKNEAQRLRSQGWQPQIIKSLQAGFDLYLVQVLSGNPQKDQKKLKALGYEPYSRQGLLPDPEE
ncbi:MAG: SPOR domain-containing protein [Spirochaetales bacterium]|nr:SPOR domain-containing protein [Spirochaetales bacterium]